MTSRAELCDSSCAEVRGARTNAEEIQGFERARNPGAGDSERRRGGANFRRIGGPVARIVSGDGTDVRRHARGRSGAPRPIVHDVSRTVRRPHSADPARGREGVSEKTATVAGAAFRRGRSAKARATDGNGSSTVLSKSRDARIAHSHAGTTESTRR